MFLENKVKLIALYKYIKELCALKYRVVTNVENQIWTCFFKDIPNDSENILIFDRNRVEGESVGDDVLLEVKKPEFQQCPQPPQTLEEWFAPGWDLFTNEVRYKEILVEVSEEEANLIEENQPEHFRDFPERVSLFEKWLISRNIWAEKQRVINRTRKFFARLYQIHTDLERDSEVLEVMVGEGMLKDVENSSINHPLMLKRVNISFDAKGNIIRIHDTDAETELYTMLLQEISNINHSAIKQMKEDLQENYYHPLDRNDTPDFLKILVHRLCSDSKFITPETEMKISNDDRLLMTLNPVFFVRKRMDGSLKAIDEIINVLETTGYIPGHLSDIICAGKIDIAVDDHDSTLEEQLAASSGESTEILLSKEANREQLEIAQRIERYNAVLVQGPPGTGKTHTIANLLGHFLAQGKSVLVTSHTKKALAVLKEKVPKGIQNLCVSVLDDTNSDMERSVDGMSEYLSKYTSNEMKRKMESANRQRLAIIEILSEIRKKIFAIKYREFQPIVYNGKGYSPAEAAVFVNKNAEELSYIPGSVRLYHPLPATIDELAILYKSNAGISELEEQELAWGIPNPELLIAPSELTALNRNKTEYLNKLNQIEYQMQSQINLDYFNDVVSLKNGSLTSNVVEKTNAEKLEEISQYIRTFNTIDQWMVHAVVDGNKGGGYKNCWEILITAIEETAFYADSIVADLLGNNIVIDSSADLLQLKQLVEKMYDIFQKKGKLSKLDLLFNRQIKVALALIKINGAAISSLEECILVKKNLILIEKRRNTEKYWNELMSKHGVPNFFSLGDEPERICMQQIPLIKRYLDWYKNEYGQLLQLINSAGLNKELIFAGSNFDSEVIRTEKTLKAIETIIPIHIQIATIFLDIKKNEDKVSSCLSILENGDRQQSALCIAMSDALCSRDLDAYTNKFTKLTNLFQKYSLKEQRTAIISKIEPIAPDWACQIKNRVGIHGETTLPQMIEEAWKWKQFAGIIDGITAEPYEELQYKAVALSQELRQKTAILAEGSAWYHLLLRTEKDLDMRQALQGWKKTIKKIGKGTGKNAPVLKKQARELMAKCQSAVPAWIMPVNKALESLNPSENVFDVIIIDEASQSDISALAIIYMAKKVIIVGDDKQVSPMAVGVDIDKMNALSEMYIKDIIPLWHLYDVKSSLYDIAATTFQPLMLREHFRCVPDIIGYSNKLSYDFKIKPLRDGSNSIIRPSIVNYRVDGGQREGRQKINAKEVETIVALMLACMDQQEYDGTSFGVISLLGDEQAQKIQQLILQKIEPSIIEERRILCGNASHFQGDERNVIFLSMVDSNDNDGPISLAGDGADQSRKQRYNVAASRAKDQMWIVHSLDVAKDLKPGDLRKDLLEYAENPKAYLQLAAEVEKKSESPFELAVGKTLVAAGYHLVQQWEVGAYRIDMVAIYNGERVAIECDGDQYHSGEEKIREDMERQTILERLGWRFIRIRGSEYYQNPKKTIERVIRELNNYGIYPENIINATGEEFSSELLSRVKIRAAQIIDEWHSAEGVYADFPELVVLPLDIIPAMKDNEAQRLPDKEKIINLQETNKNFHGEKIKENPSSNESSQFIKKTVPITPNHSQEALSENDQLSFFTSQIDPHSEPPLKALNKIVANPMKTESIIKFLKTEGITFIDKREQSGIVWALYSEETKSKIESFFEKMAMTIVLEKRGSSSTGNKPAWRIMIK